MTDVNRTRPTKEGAVLGEAKSQKPTAYPMKGIDDLPLHEIIEPALDITSPQFAGVGIGVRAVCGYDCVYCYAGHSNKRGDMSV
jgi:sulfatase maturation enzyme AslB (radical SAM superfamily)